MTGTSAQTLDERVGPYTLVRAIGAGGSARIDLARIDRAYGFARHVVIKRPLEHLRGDPNVAASLRREARIGGRLRHPNLVAVLDAGTHAGYDYLALEYVRGTSLRELMQTEVGGRVRAVPLAVALGIVVEIARGLHDAHQLTDDRGEPLGLVHRDVSPGNVLLGLDGSVKVADFGIAKETRVTTLSGSMHGTVTYMAPEQCRGHAFDRRADIWALGVILHELVTRQRLFWADNDVASLHKVLSGQVPRPRKVDPDLAIQLDEIVMTAVAQDPQGRFATARDFADAIESYAANQGIVLGARQLARTMEDVAGQNPHARTDPTDRQAALPAADPEPSLVDVLGRIEEPDPEPLLPTFGPSDGASEDVAPATPPQPPTSRRIGIVIGAAAIAGIAIGAVLALKGGPKAPALEPPTQMIVTPPPGPIAPKRPEPEPVPEPEHPIVTEPTVTTPPPPRAHRSPKHLTNPPTAGSNDGVVSQPVPEPPAPAAGSGAKPHVEWNPTMLLPTDSGRTKKP